MVEVRGVVLAGSAWVSVFCWQMLQKLLNANMVMHINLILQVASICFHHYQLAIAYDFDCGVEGRRQWSSRQMSNLVQFCACSGYFSNCPPGQYAE